MNTIKIDKKNCLMIAHRGVSGLERENTCPAFVAAGVKTYFGIETDVHVTKDKHFIICHDDNIQRVTGVDMVIEESNFDDIRKHPILETDGTLRSDLIFPTLEDYIRICKKYDKIAVLELKCYIQEEDIVSIVEVVKSLGWFEHTIFISFWKENLIAVRKHYADATLQFLTSQANDETLEFLLQYRLDLDIQFCPLTAEYVAKMHQNGIKVNCWTPDHPEDAKRLIEMGVDMITSNILE